jgi:hypothetical protein
MDKTTLLALVGLTVYLMSIAFTVINHQKLFLVESKPNKLNYYYLADISMINFGAIFMSGYFRELLNIDPFDSIVGWFQLVIYLLLLMMINMLTAKYIIKLLSKNKTKEQINA